MNITGGKFNSLIIKTADFANIKPTLSKIRQAVFNSLSSMLEQKENMTFCDLFSGSGIMAFEAVSRGFDVSAVEIDRKSANYIKKNAEDLKIEIDLIVSDAIKFLKTTDKTFDVIYIDPPYHAGLYEVVLSEIKSKNILNDNGIIILEKPSSLEIKTDYFFVSKEKKYSDKTILYLGKV